MICIIFLAVVFSTVSRAGDNLMSAVNVTAAPGQEAVIGIILDNADVVNGLQFDIVLPEGIQLVVDDKGSPLIVPTERTKGFSVICKNLEPGRYRMMSLSFQGSKVSGNSGMVLSVTLKCDASMKQGVSTVRFENVHLSYSNTELNKDLSNLPSFEAQVTLK